MSKPPQRRKEAAPLEEPEKRFTDAQNEAFKRAQELLEQARNSDEKAEDASELRPSLAVLDAHRSNNVILIDGGRGSGKTTVLLTLLQSLRKRFDETTSWFATTAGEAPATTSNRVAIPLELIDLQPLSNTVNLLLFVLGRLLRVVEELEAERVEPRARARFSAGGDGELPSRAAWRELATAVAIGWSVDLGRRSGSVDLEQFAVELDQSTRVGVQLTRYLRRFLNCLAKDYQEASGREPLFVIPIDDADMNPRRAVELIELLRTLWHPRLAFLLTGDSPMFLACLRAHYLGELRRTIGPGAATSAELESLGHREHVNLAIEVYNRVVPPSHRCSLREIEPAERLTLILDAFDGDAEVASGPALRNLENRLLLISVGKTNLGALNRTLPQYWEMLPSRLRALKDLDGQLSAAFLAGAQAGVASYGRAVVDIWSQAIQRSALTSDEQRELQGLITENETGGLTIAGSSVEWVEQTLILRSREESRFHLTEHIQQRVEARFLRTDLDGRIQLRGQTTAALLFAIAVAAESPSQSKFLGDWPSASFLPRLVRIRRWSVSLQAEFQASWPVPEWPALHTFHHLERLWEERCNWLNDRNWGAWLFMACVVEVATNTPLDFITRVRAFRDAKDDLPHLPSAWVELAKRLVDLSLKVAWDSPLERATATWALRSALIFAAPEYAMDSPNFLIDAIRQECNTREAKELSWDLLRDYAQRERRERMQAALRAAGTDGTPNDADTVIDELDAIDGTFKRAMLVDPGKSDALLPLRRVLATVPIRGGLVLSGWSANDASVYLNYREPISRALSTADIALLVEKLNGPRTPAWRLTKLWQQVARPSARDRVIRDGGRLSIRGLQVGYKSEPIDHGVVDADRMLQLGEVKVVLDFAGVDGAPGSTEELLLRIIYDLAADESDLEAPRNPGARLNWPGALVLDRNGQGWPTVAWPAVLDHELLETSWNQWGVGAAEEIGQNAENNARLADVLALRYLYCLDGILRSRQPDLSKWNGGLAKDEDWSAALDRLQAFFLVNLSEPLPSSHGARAGAFWAFFSRIIELADPVAGLSLAASNAIVRNLRRFDPHEWLARGPGDAPRGWEESEYFKLRVRVTAPPQP